MGDFLNMILFLYGPDTYRSRQKLKEIVEEYKKRHQSGLNFIKIDFSKQEFSDFKQAVETVSMFDEKKLIILENIFQEEILEYLKNRKIDDVVIFWAEDVDSKNKLFQFLKKKAKVQEFKFLKGNQLNNWIKDYVKKEKADIENLAVEKLVEYVGSDLWRMRNELDKLISFSRDIKEESIKKLVKPEIDVNIFDLIDALGVKNKKRALELIHDHLKKGESEGYLLNRFVYQFRNLIKVKTGGGKDLHPFVFRKTQSQARNFDFDELKKIYRKLLEIDLDIKTGKIDARTALELFVTEL